MPPHSQIEGASSSLAISSLSFASHYLSNQDGKDWQLNSWQDLISCQSQLWYLVNVTGVLLEPVQENEGRTNTFSIAVRRCALVLYTKNCKSRASWPRAPQLNSFTIKQLPSSLAPALPPRLTHSPKPFNPFWNNNNSRFYISDKVLVKWPWHASCVHMKARFFQRRNNLIHMFHFISWPHDQNKAAPGSLTLKPQLLWQGCLLW